MKPANNLPDIKLGEKWKERVEFLIVGYWPKAKLVKGEDGKYIVELNMKDVDGKPGVIGPI
jgi:hypothetical protein